jgi:hypothetical protein
MLLSRKFIDINEIRPDRQANPTSFCLLKKKKTIKKYDSEKSNKKNNIELKINNRMYNII